jgi:spore maturation protein CgeB
MEAEFFSSNEELLTKVQYYLGKPEEREKIARAGRERCVKSEYSMRAQLSQMLCAIYSMNDISNSIKKY